MSKKYNKDQAENTDVMLELSESDVEKLVCRQLLRPLSMDNMMFVYEFFNKGWFKNNTLNTIYKMLHAFYTKYDRIPTRHEVESIFKNDVFASQIANINPMLESLYSFDESGYSDQFVRDNITKFAKARAIYFAIFNNIEDIEERGDIGGCMSEFERIVRMEMNTDMGTNYFKNIDQHIEKLHEENNRIPTGFSEIDKMTYGGLPADDTCLMVIMAQPGLGKSQMLRKYRV